MNTFRFIGTIIQLKDNKGIKHLSNGSRVMKFMVKQNNNNSAFVQINGDTLNNGKISVYLKDKQGRYYLSYDQRFDSEKLKQISFASKLITNLGTTGNKDKEFIYREDFIDYISEQLNLLPLNTIYEVKGEFVITEYKGKFYNNFNVKSIKTVPSITRPELTMSLDLFYNYEGLDEKDKANKFILNAYISQYSYKDKRNKYYPIQVEFITNRFDFKNQNDIEIIRHRKANMHPTKEQGFVKAIWEAQYVRGAQMILPPLETLPKDIQFEIKNAGRDITEYMSNIVTEAQEIICLTRPNNTLAKDGAVYTPLNCTENEFKSQIYNYNDTQNETIDNMALKEALENPFN